MTTKRLSLVLVIAVTAWACVAANAEQRALYPVASPPWLTLVEDGQPKATIVMASGAGLEARHAAAELAGYVRRISGAELTIGDASGDQSAVVLEVDPRLNPPASGQRSWPGSRGYRLRVEGNRLHVIGADPLSVLYGVYGLVERHLGVRWLWPGELGEVVPEQKTIRVGKLDETSVPDFPVRWVGTGDWALHHGGNAMVQVGGQTVGVHWKWHFHTFATLIPAEKYYDVHPDWFPLVDGKRKRPDQPNSQNTQLCTTNPELIREMVRNLRAVLDAEPETDVIALSPNDSGGFCECERCRALDEPSRGWFARYSRRLATLNNEIAAQIAQSHPRVLVKVGAYAMYLRQPLDPGLAPTANQIVQACHIYCCHNHPIPGERCVAGKTYQPSDKFVTNREFREILAGWGKVTPHLFIYEYYSLGGPGKEGLLWPMVHTMREDMPYYHRIGAEGFYTQLNDRAFYRDGLNYYVAAKLAWNTRLDADLIVEDYCRHAFGPAAGPMLAWFRRLERAMTDADLCLSYGLESPRRWGPKVFSASVMRDTGELLEQALAAGSGPEKQRVEFFQRGFNEMRDALARMGAAGRK